MKRIICVGNRFFGPDSAGPMTYDRLASRRIPPGVEVIDGGLAGLDLLRLVEGAERVVFVDAVIGFGGGRGVFVLDRDAAVHHAGTAYDHAAGLAYLLRVLPRVCDGAMPEMHLVGVLGPIDEDSIDAAADVALSIAVEGVRSELTMAMSFAGAAP